MDDLIIREQGTKTLDAETTAIVSATIKEILSPILAGMADFMARNTEAMERMAAQQKIQSDRMEALEKQIRLNTPVTPAQVKHLQAEIRKRARDLLSKKSLENDPKAVNKTAASIRKAVLTRYGVAALNEIPRHEYSITMNQIDTWNDTLVMLDVAREAKKRAVPGKSNNGFDDKQSSGLLEEG